MQGSLKFLFIINPVSGGKNKANWEIAIKDYFKGLPHSLEFHLLSGKDDETSARNCIDNMKPDRIIAVGGDGTVKMIVKIAVRTNYTIGILPAGSANGMSKELNIPPDIAGSLKVITEGIIKKVDAIKINGNEICFHLSDIGMNAMLVKYFERSGKRGMMGYGKALFRVLWGKKNIDATIKIDNQTIKRKAYMIVIANARKYGTGAIINPEGKIDDGKFEVVAVRKLSFWELFKMLVTHSHFDSECIEFFHTKQLELTTKTRTYFQVDGEFFGKTTKVTAEIIPRQVNIMVPR